MVEITPLEAVQTVVLDEVAPPQHLGRMPSLIRRSRQ